MALVALCCLDYRAAWPGIYLLPIAVALSLLGAGELLAMFRKRGHQPLAWVIYGGTAVAVLLAAAPGYLPIDWSDLPTGRLGWLAIGLAAGLLIAMIGELRRFDSPGRATTQMALSSFAIVYIGGLMGFLIQLRLLGGGAWGDDGHWGMLALVSLIATVKMSDTGQYTAGRLFGTSQALAGCEPGQDLGRRSRRLCICAYRWLDRVRLGGPSSCRPGDRDRVLYRGQCSLTNGRVRRRVDGGRHPRRLGRIAAQARRRRERFQFLAAGLWRRAGLVGLTPRGGTSGLCFLGPGVGWTSSLTLRLVRR